jgi:hypothetical protein
MAQLTKRTFLTRNDITIAAKTAASITVAIATGTGFEYIGTVAVTPTDLRVAHAIGLARTEIARANKLNSSKFRRGAETDERIDTEGALGEWLTANILERSGADLDVAAFVAHKAPKGEVDLILEGSRIDVKTIGASCNRNCNINAEQHAAKAPAAYLVVHLAGVDAAGTPTVADLFVVKAADLTVPKADGGKWELRQGWSPYFNCYMRQQLERLPAAA